jgi:hypothetical protein
MKQATYLEMTYRHGKPLAGYLYLPRREGDKVDHSKAKAPGLVVDFASDGRPMGVEIVSPSIVTLDAINTVLRELHQESVDADEMAPLLSGK